MTAKKRSILMSVMTLVLCLALVAGGTYALFTEDFSLTTHLEAGELKVELWRTKLTSYGLDPTTGYVNQTGVIDDVDKNFTTPTTENIFGLKIDEQNPENNEKIAPGCSYVADLELRNGGDVAFGYWLEIVFDATNVNDLSEQIKVDVKVGNTTVSKYVSQLNESFGSDDELLATVTKGGTGTFTVTATFVDDKVVTGIVNNDAENKTIEFDIKVHAVQALKAN